MKQVNIIGRTATKNGRYWVCVTTLGVESTRSITASQYHSLEQANGPKLASLGLPGEVVTCAHGDHLYDTFSGKLEDGCYAVESPTRTLVKRDSATLQAGIPPRMVVADALTAEGEAEVNWQHGSVEEDITRWQSH